MEIKPEQPVRQGNKMSDNLNGNGEKKIMSDLQRFVALIFTIIASTAGAMLYYAGNISALQIRLTAIEVQQRNDQAAVAAKFEMLQNNGTELARRDHDNVTAMQGTMTNMGISLGEIKAIVNAIQQTTSNNSMKLEEHLRESKTRTN